MEFHRAGTLLPKIHLPGSHFRFATFPLSTASIPNGKSLSRFRVHTKYTIGFLVSSLEVAMKKFFLRSLLALVLALGLAAPVLADTVRLKDGSVIKGEVVGFRDQQFTIMVGAGARGRRSRITVYMEDVESIEFDGAGSVGTGPADTASSAPIGNNQPTSSQPSYIPPAGPSTPGGTPPPTFFQINVKVRADNANNGWTNSGLVVRRGQRIRINASGRVSIGGGRFVTPDGLPNIPDRDKLLRNQPTGGLIAVIGDDNDDFIFIGRNRDFVAQRDGVLFLGVNEGNLSDNSGTFDIVIEAEAAGSTPR
jgi:hypothetical protein